MFRVSLLAALLAIVQAQPPPGPTDQANCPVTGHHLNITADTPFVNFVNGQQLYFASSQAASLYRATPRAYWLAPNDMPLPGMDGMRGLPDMRGMIRYCPRTNETLNISMSTPRVVQLGGQSVYFCCHGCVTAFWRSPTDFIAP
jgi:YHS domain-containing protein